MAAAPENFSRDGSKQQQGAFRAKGQALNNNNNNSSSSNNNCCSSGSSGGDAVMVHTPAGGHTTLHSCFPSSESPATPDSPTDSHLSMDPPATFSEQEDELLRELVKRHGTKKWHIISAKMHNKTPRECRKRWRTYLHMCMNKSSWSEEEDRLLIEGHNAYGNRWTEIAKMVPGRTDNAVKNRYNALCKKRSHRPGKSVSLNGMPALQNSEGSDQIVKDVAKRGKKLKHREDGTSMFLPCVSRSSCVKHILSIEIPGDNEIQSIEGGRKPLSALSHSDASSFQEMRDCATGDPNSPRDGQVDMEEVMGWLLARTPTPTCNGSRNSNSTVTSSTSTSPAQPNEDISCSYQSNAITLRKDPIQQLSMSLKTPTSSRASLSDERPADVHSGSMSNLGEDADCQGDIPTPDVPSPRTFENPPSPDDYNDNLAYHSSQEIDDSKQEKNSIALPQFKSKNVVNPSHFNSYQIYNLFNPARGIRDEMVRKGIAPRNHHKANVAAIALKSAKVHASKEILPVVDESIAGLPKLGKIHAPPSTRASLQQISKLRSHERIDQTSSNTPDNLSTTTENSQTKSRKNGEKVDYLARNKSSLASVAEMGRKKRDFTVPEVPANENYGKIPPYLLRRKLELLHCKEQMEQEERDRHLPPGLILMRDEERLEVLKTLEENKEKLVAKLRGLPLIIETPSLIRAKGEIDSQLKEVEDSIKRFSRPKVYIRYTS